MELGKEPPKDTTNGTKPAADSGDEWYDNVRRESKRPDETVVDLEPDQCNNNRGNTSIRKGSLMRQDAKDPTSPPTVSEQPSYPLEVINKTHGSTGEDPDKESRI